MEGLKENVENLNNFIMETFNQTLSCTKEAKIKSLEKIITKKDKEIAELKGEVEKTKEFYEKALKEKRLEYEMLKLDYQSAIMQNINSKSGNGRNKENKKNEKIQIKSEKSEISEKSATKSNRLFKLSAIKSPMEDTEERPTRRTRGKKNTIKITDDIGIEEDFYYHNDEDFENELEELEDSFMEDELDDEDMLPIKKGKRKARESKKKPPQTKKVKKNENKELLLVNRNTINYHLFN